jgi:hypothetical protein
MLGNALGDTVPCELLCLRYIFKISTYVTIRGTSAAIASSILFAATGGLHKGQFVCTCAVRNVSGGVGVRNENGGCGSPSLLDSICYTGKDGLAEML